ncbi:GNAT family N-acetyltransferase [Amorphus coralli]|uniref:GNAT family N-acetyltransferase n=1 Tax=Amorphus coralli TaxID=340680 RepID=UPI00036A1D57|nr:GNAT family N-acetyltransferase [Amorphus coralli]
MAALATLDEPIETVALGMGDIEAIDGLFRATVAAVPNPAAVRPDEPAFFEEVLDRGGEIVGLTVHGALVAYGVLRPEFPDQHDRRGLSRLVRDDWPLFVTDGSAVHPAYWTHSLQRVLIRERIDRAVRQGARTIIAKVSPANLPSMRNLLKEHFRIVALVRKPYGWRYVHQRSAVDYPETSVIPEIWRTAADVDAAQILFEAGYGAVRFRLGEEARPELGFVKVGA